MKESNRKMTWFRQEWAIAWLVAQPIPKIMNKQHCDVILTGDGPFSTSAMSTFVDQGQIPIVHCCRGKK